jgi:predicted MFS family arabinose efflux permease
MPTLPFYLADYFHVSNLYAGFVIAIYVLASTIVKPIAAFFADTFDRRSIYIITYFIFIALFAGYVAAAVISFFILVRILQGFAFGALMTTSNALVIDIIPPRRQGEGIGYFGLSSTFAMSIGPVIGLLIYEYFDFHYIFYGAILFGIFGLILSFLIKPPAPAKTRNEPITLDRFFLVKGIPIGINFLLLGMSYATMTTYIAMYGKELGVWGSSGFFFIVLSVGLIVSRLFSGKSIDKGRIIEIIKLGNLFATFAFFCLFFADKVPSGHATIYYLSALMIGLSYGMVFPSVNVMFINLAPHNRRAAASSTYLTSWDLGIGLGIIVGGQVIDGLGISSIYAFAGFSCMVSAVYFIAIASSYFMKNKLR